MVDTDWDSLLGDVCEWIILRFALSTDRDLWTWIFVIGAAAHLEYLAVAVLWVADQKSSSFTEYQTKMTLGQAAHRIRQKSLLDSTTVETLEGIAKLRNSVTHRGATYGVSLRHNNRSSRDYKGQQVFTNPEGLKQMMNDMDAATGTISAWLRQRGLGTGEGAPA
jgi:hypothetical protein